MTRFIRLFSYGSLSVVLVFYLSSLGLNEAQTGLLLTLTLLGDTVISLGLTTQADRIGRRRMLIIGAVLMAGAGVAFASTRNFLFLVAAGTIGVISPSGNEVGPFLPIEQAALTHVVPARERTTVFAWYALAGNLATAMGSLFAGVVTQALQKAAVPVLSSERTIIVFYAAMGVLLGLLFHRLSPAAEVRPEENRRLRPADAAWNRGARAVWCSACPASLPWMRLAAVSSCRASRLTGSTFASEWRRQRWAAFSLAPMFWPDFPRWWRRDWQRGSG